MIAILSVRNACNPLLAGNEPRSFYQFPEITRSPMALQFSRRIKIDIRWLEFAKAAEAAFDFHADPVEISLVRVDADETG